MQRPRPLTIDFVAILNFIIGTLAIVGSCYAAATIVLLIIMANAFPMPSLPAGQPNPLATQADLYQNKIPGFIPFMTVSMLLSSLMGLLLIIGSVGLYRLKQRGRTLCVIWCGYYLISALVGTVYNFVFVIPVMVAYTEETYAQMAKAGIPTAAPPTWTQYIGIPLGLLPAAYAIAMPLLLYRRSVSEALAGKWVPPWQRLDGHNKEDREEDESESPPSAPDPTSAGIPAHATLISVANFRGTERTRGQLMRRERPPTVTVLGIGNIVIGALGLLCGTCGVSAYAVVMAAANAPAQGGANPTRAFVDCLQREAPSAFTIDLVKALFLLLLSVVLVVAGIGLLSMQNWARWLSLGCAVGSVLLNGSYLVFQLAYEIPAMRHCQAMAGQPAGAGAPGFAAGQAVGNAIGVIGVGAVWILYPILLFVLLLLPNVSEAFSPAPRRRRRKRRRREEEYEEEYDDNRDEDDE